MPTAVSAAALSLIVVGAVDWKDMRAFTATTTDHATFTVSSDRDLILSGGSAVTPNPLLVLRAGNPQQHSIATLLMPLNPGTTVEQVAFEYRYDTGFGAPGTGTGANFSLLAAGVTLYSSPHYTDFAYDEDKKNFSAAVSVSTSTPVAVPTGHATYLDLHFDCNDRNIQLLLPLSFNLTCSGHCFGPPSPPPPRQYCPAPMSPSSSPAMSPLPPLALYEVPAGAAAEDTIEVQRNVSGYSLNVSDSHANDVRDCLRPDGSVAPCGPGNQLCPPGPFGQDAPQFHVRDLSCGENDPNGPVFDPVHVPISIWNDRPYDEHAIYTGSATVVDGQVVQVYPGLCYPQFSDYCPGGTNLAIAVPADPRDPLQTNWTKDVYTVNPIVNATGRDPSTAWRTPDGEWRLTTFDTMIMGSMDFKSWYRIGRQPGFPVGECPSFFVLPRTTPGAGAAPAGTPTPTHVHKASHGGKDFMQVGMYTAGPPRSNGNWTALLGEVKIDAGNFYASKDFYDPVGGRRINFGWATVPPASTQTLPREVTWHPELQQLCFSPVEEQSSLRRAVIGSLVNVALTANVSSPFNMPKQAGNQSELRVSFERPAAAVRLSVNVMVDAARAAKGTEFFIEYEPAEINQTAKVRVGSGGTTDTLSLLPRDKTIDLALYVDNTFTEAFWMDGRVAMTVVTRSSGGQDDATISASQPGVTATATAWSVGSIWVTPEQVKRTPRRDQPDSAQPTAPSPLARPAATTQLSTTQPSASQLTKVLLSDAPSTFGARCLDGSPPAYYIRKASAAANASKFLVYFQGGGWCYTRDACLRRSKGALGSSRGYPDVLGDKGGILSGDGAVNPDFATWNAVWVPYCDGGSWSGNRASSDGGLWYRGRANMLALVSDLLSARGMASATDVLIDGGSAGGLTTLLHADYFRSLLPAAVRFGAIGDAGWFRPDATLDKRGYAADIRRMSAMMNATSNKACEAAHPNDEVACMFAPAVFPFLASSMFVLEAAYDSWQLLNVLGLPCSSYGRDLSQCSAADNQTLDAYGDAMRASIGAAIASTAHHKASAGCFVSACITHVQSADNEGHNQWSLVAAGRTVRSVVGDWFFFSGREGAAARDGRLIEACPHFPCNPQCQRFTGAPE